MGRASEEMLDVVWRLAAVGADVETSVLLYSYQLHQYFNTSRSNYQLHQYFDRLVLNIPTVFLRLKHHLNGVGCGILTVFFPSVTHIGRCWVWEIGSRIDISHMFPILIETKMRSGLYPFFHLTLFNDFKSFAL